jgi:hypothetical protein
MSSPNKKPREWTDFCHKGALISSTKKIIVNNRKDISNYQNQPTIIVFYTSVQSGFKKACAAVHNLRLLILPVPSGCNETSTKASSKPRFHPKRVELAQQTFPCSFKVVVALLHRSRTCFHFSLPISSTLPHPNSVF